MILRTQLSHLDEIEKVLNEFEKKKAFVFGAACLERQWPIYDRVCKDKVWNRKTFLRECVDDIWGWLLDFKDAPMGYAAKCEEMIVEKIVGNADNAASEVSISIYGFTSIIENMDVSGVIQLPQSNLRIIENYLYDMLGLKVTNENDITIENHELMQGEMKHQIDDAKMLKEDLSRKLVETIKDRSTGTNILAKYWFN